MKDVKMLFLGAPRTATTSLFYMLRGHHQICTPKIKELMNNYPSNLLYTDFKRYLKNFSHKDKILLDGTPGPYYHHKEIFNSVRNSAEIKIIYPIRNPAERLYSYCKLLSFVKYREIISNGNWKPYKNKKIPEIEVDGSINSIELQNTAFYIRDVNFVNEITNLDVLVFNFDEMRNKIPEIIKFIGIEDTGFILRKHNSLNNFFNRNDPFFQRVREGVQKFFDKDGKDYKNLLPMWIEDLEIIQDKFKIDLGSMIGRL